MACLPSSADLSGDEIPDVTRQIQSTARQGTTPIDVAIIGAGPAGLSAAHRLAGSGLSVRVLEQSAEVGGRTRSVEVAGEMVNTGAMFVYVGTRSADLCHELDIATAPVTPRTFGVHYAGRTVLAYDDRQLVDGLRLPAGASAQLARLLREVRAEYEAYTGIAGLTAASERLAQVSFSEHIGSLDPAVQAIVRNAVRGGSTADPEDLSAQYALRYFASYLVRAAGHRRYIPGGMQEMCKALQLGLSADVLMLNARVDAVSRTGSGAYAVRTHQPGGHHVYSASQVVFATPGPSVLELAPWLPSWKAQALSGVPTNPTVTLAIVLDSSGMPMWDDIFAVVTVGTVFNLVLQPRASADVQPSKRGRTYFTCYLSADAAAAAPGDDAATTRAWLEDFFKVVPGARTRVLGTLLTRWPRCFSYPRADRSEIVPGVRAQVDGLHFAGDYASSTAGTHGAFAEGDRVAAEVLHAAERRGVAPFDAEVG